MRRRVLIVLAAVAALAAAGLAFAKVAVEDRISLKATGGNVLEHYSPALAIVAVSPSGYRRGCCYDSNGGEWTGPRYIATGDPAEGAVHKFDWSVGVAVRQGVTRAALVANLTQDWPVVSEGKQLVKHRVGGRAAGTISGYWILTRSPGLGANDARFEAMVGLSLCDGNNAFASFDLLVPSSNSASSGEFNINGMRMSDWNTAKAMQSIRAIRFERESPRDARHRGRPRSSRLRARPRLQCASARRACRGAPAANRQLVGNGFLGHRGRRVLVCWALRRDVSRARGDANERARARSLA